jgi:adenine-specific DNA-methyltransferase
MQKITTQSPESKSYDFIAQNIAKLKELFPELLTEGKDGVAVNLDVLKQLVGDKTVTDAEEKYGLNWHGKRRARQLALTPSTGTLRPCPEDSVDWETTQNLMIEGDNLEVLKLLQKSYAGKVKLIYIDPPYNTGKDFVYPDNFQDNIKNYLELTGQVENGRKISSNTEASGRFHTDWLNMMYPRLKLARNLLREDGVILVSLDDTEAANIRLLMNDVFGEENFVGVFPWRSRTAKADVPFGVSKDFEWIIAYGKPYFTAGRKGERKYYKSDDCEDRWRLSDLTKQTTKDERPNSFFTIINPKTGEKYPANPNRTWSITEDTFVEYYRKKKIVFPGDYDFLNISKPAFRVFEREDKEKALLKHGTEEVRMPISTYLPEEAVGRTEHGSKIIRELFGEQVFSFPKPVGLINFFIENATDKNSIVLDFFAGSGTTGHAVMAQNAADGGNRRYILVQLPEPLDPENKEQKTAANFCDKLGKPRNIAELTKERLRHAGKKLKAASPHFEGDIGFRVFKLDSTNIREWDTNCENLAASLEASVEHLKSDRTEQDILFELLLKLGLDLCVPIEKKRIAKHEIHSIGAGTIIVCLSKRISQFEVEPLALGIAVLHKELKPAGETLVVFRDSAFVDDVTKTNLSAILQQHGLETIRSL